MGRDYSKTSLQTIIDCSVQDSINKLIGLKDQLTCIHNISVYLPVIVKDRNLGDETLEIINMETASLSQGSWYSLQMNVYDIMRLFWTEKAGQRKLGISLSFPGEFVPQYVNKHPNYFYITKKTKVTIGKFLTTLKTEEIKKHINQLTNECVRFYFLYCEPFKMHIES